jgi:MOB kinase activator 1
MKTIFGGEAEVIVERNLETLWVSNLPVLDSVSSGDLQLGCFKNFRKLYLDCCPMLKTIPSSQLPENLEVLQIKFCDKLETLFMPNTSTEFKLQNLKKVYLVELPNLTSIGVLETSIGVLETESLPDIFPSTKSIKINFRGCPKLANLDKIKKLPHLNVQVLS